MLNIVSAKAGGQAQMSAKNGSIKLVAGNSNPALAQQIASVLGLSLTKASVRRFADGEVFVEIQEMSVARMSSSFNRLRLPPTTT